MQWLLEILYSSYRPIMVGLFGGIFIYFITVYSVKKKIVPIDGKYTLKAGKTIKTFVILLLILSIAISLSIFLGNEEQIFSAFMVIIFFIIVNYYLIKTILLVTITFDDDVINIKKRKCSEMFHWDEISVYQYSNFLHSYILTVNNRKVYISAFLNGIGDFKKKLLEIFEDSKEDMLDIGVIMKLAIGNKDILKESNKCGCFSCITIFNYNDIYDYIEASDGTIRMSAICPNCSEIETVIGDASGIAITKDNLLYLSKIVDGNI